MLFKFKCLYISLPVWPDCPALHCLVLHACQPSGSTQKYQIYHYTIDSEQIHKYLYLCKLPLESEQITALDTFDGVNENTCLVSSVYGDFWEEAGWRCTYAQTSPDWNLERDICKSENFCAEAKSIFCAYLHF